MSLPARTDDANDEMIPQPGNRGALRRGGKRGNKGGGPMPSEIRRLLRERALEKLPAYWQGFNDLTPDQQQKALDMALKYGVGIQVEQVTKAEIESQAKAMLSVFVDWAREKWNIPTEQIQECAAAMARAVTEDKA